MSAWACIPGVRRREIDEDKDNKVTLAGSGAGQSSAFASSVAKMGPTGSTAAAERPRSELLEGVELRRPRAVQPRLSPDDACGIAQPNPLHQQQTTTSSFAGEPELFKVFARRSLKQKPGPHDEKQDTETEKEKVASRIQQQENKDKEQGTREGKAAGHKHLGSHPEPSAVPTVKSGLPQIRSVADAKRISEPQVGQGVDHSSPTALTSGPNPTSVELLPSKKELSKLKVGSNVKSVKDREKESTVPPSQETGGPTSLPALRREADQLRKQQSLAQPPSGHQPEPSSPGGQVGPGGPRSLLTAASLGQTVGTQQQSGEKRASAVLLQRASSVAVRGSEENATEDDNALMGGDQDSGQPEWLRLAQKKREKRELKEKMDNTSVAANNAANVHDTASNNKLSNSNNSVSNQERPLKKLISHFNK